MSKGAEQLERLFALHASAVESLSREGKSTDAKELGVAFKKFIAIAADSFLKKEIVRIGDEANLTSEGRTSLLNFVTSFEMEGENGALELTEAVKAYRELREARNAFAHEPAEDRGERDDPNWDNLSVEDIKRKYELALNLLPRFKEKADAFSGKQREKVKAPPPAAP